MPSLTDIAPLIETVPIRGMIFEVRGIGAEGVVYLLNRFPVLRAIMTGHQMQDMTLDALIALAPEAVDAIIATGLGEINNPAAEAGAHNLGIDEQIMVLEKIMEVTLPRGIGPFVDMINRLASKAGGDGWGAGTRSAAQSNSASRTAIPRPSPGSTPQENSQDGSSSQPEGASESRPSSSA